MAISHAKAPEAGGDAYDVVIVGGGAAGLAAAVFTARYGFETVVFDRGGSAIRQCYCIENYLGFLGIDPGTFLELGRGHAAYEGAEIVDDAVVGVREAAGGDSDGEGAERRFRVQTQDGQSVAASYVVAASAYDADYLCSLRDGSFHDEGDHPVDCDEATGRTGIDGLYVAGWLSGGPHQVLISAGHGARVAKALAHDHRRAERGYWADVADYWDWRVEPDAYSDEEWGDHVEEWVRGTLPDEHGYDEVEIQRVCEEIKRQRREHEQSEAERRERIERGRELLQRYLDGA